jgi:DNA-binding ferritin-like protein (Dps family)
MVDVFDGILELFEEGAAARRPVLEITGPDVAAFAINVLNETRVATWTGRMADRLNSEVHRRLGEATDVD